MTSSVFRSQVRLVTVLTRLRAAKSKTLVLIVDQGEQMLTLQPGERGDAYRLRFFEFLGFLTNETLDLKLIISFRTEYHGRLYSLLRAGGSNAERVGDYYVEQLREQDLVEAILRPTRQTPVPEFEDLGAPGDRYKFSFEEWTTSDDPAAANEPTSVARLIARDLIALNLSGATLTVMQIVCRQLYQQALERRDSDDPDSRAVISRAAYRRLGGLEGQIDLYLERALSTSYYDSIATRLSLTGQLSRYIQRWRDTLGHLTRPQPGGNVTTDLISHDDLLARASTYGISGKDFESTLTTLGGEAWKIVEQVEVPRFGSTERIFCYRLGHDALALVLHREQLARKKTFAAVRTSLMGYGIVGLVMAFFARNDRNLMLVAVGLSMLSFIVAGLGDRTKVTRAIYRLLTRFLT